MWGKNSTKAEQRQEENWLANFHRKWKVETHLIGSLQCACCAIIAIDPRKIQVEHREQNEQLVHPPWAIRGLHRRKFRLAFFHFTSIRIKSHQSTENQVNETDLKIPSFCVCIPSVRFFPSSHFSPRRDVVVVAEKTVTRVCVCAWNDSVCCRTHCSSWPIILDYSPTATANVIRFQVNFHFRFSPSRFSRCPTASTIQIDCIHVFVWFAVWMTGVASLTICHPTKTTTLSWNWICPNRFGEISLSAHFDWRAQFNRTRLSVKDRWQVLVADEWEYS